MAGECNVYRLEEGPSRVAGGVQEEAHCVPEEERCPWGYMESAEHYVEWFSHYAISPFHCLRYFGKKKSPGFL